MFMLSPLSEWMRWPVLIPGTPSGPGQQTGRATHSPHRWCVLFGDH